MDEFNIGLIIYLWGFFVYGTVLIDELTFKDILISYIVAIIWPITMPVRLLKGILNFLENV